VALVCWPALGAPALCGAHRAGAASILRAILQQVDYWNHARFANAMGDVELVSPEVLAPYTAYQRELGAFHSP